jgi:hypothetical protein
MMAVCGLDCGIARFDILGKTKLEVSEYGTEECVRYTALEDVFRRDAPAEEVEDKDLCAVKIFGCHWRKEYV